MTLTNIAHTLPAGDRTEAAVHQLPIAWALHAADIKSRAVKVCGTVLAMSCAAQALEQAFADGNAGIAQTLCDQIAADAIAMRDQARALEGLIAAHRRRHPHLGHRDAET